MGVCSGRRPSGRRWGMGVCRPRRRARLVGRVCNEERRACRGWGGRSRPFAERARVLFRPCLPFRPRPSAHSVCGARRMKPRGRQPDRWHQWRGSRTQRLSAHASEAARGAATACGWLCGATEAWPLCLKMFEGLVGGQKFVGGIAPLQFRKKGYITYRGTHPDHRDRSARLREVPPNRSLKFVRIFRTPVRIILT